MTTPPFTLHHTIEAAMKQAATAFKGDPTAGDGLNGFMALARLYIENDVQAWIEANWTPKRTQACGAINSRYETAYPCVLQPGHPPVMPNGHRTHIDADGDTW